MSKNSKTPDQNGWRPHSFVVAALVLLAIAAAYANSFQNAFEFDDFHTIVDNPAIRSLGNVPRFFTDATTFSVLPANRTYRPVVSTSLAIDYALGRGYVPTWFHLSTFVWFLVLVGLMAVLSRQIYDKAQAGQASSYLAWIAAAWFGLHPAAAETLNYIIQRGDLYCTLGCVAALVIWSRYPRLRRTGLYLLPVAMALLSKPPAAVFPALLFFFVLFFESDISKGRWRRAAFAAAPSLALTVGLMLLQSAMTPRSFTPTELAGWPYRLTQPYVWLRYFGSLFLPIHLNVDSDLSPLQSFGWEIAAGFLFVAALLAAIFYTAKQKRFYPICYGLIWFVVTQLPTSLYPLSEVENDHRMFFSFAGLLPAAVWAGYLLWLRAVPQERKRMRLEAALLSSIAVVLAFYGYGTHLRNAVWHTQETLWLDDVKKSPHNGRGLMIYGLTQMNKGAYPVSLDYFTRALQFTPNYATLETNLGIVHGAMNQPGDAERHFLRAVELAPTDDSARAFYARWLLQQGRLREAAEEARQAVELNPARQIQHDVLMDAYSQLGETHLLHAAALAALAAAPEDMKAQAMLQGNPNRGPAEWVALSLDQYRRGEYQQAIASSEKALQLDPQSAAAWNNIGASYAAMQRWDRAVESERKALAIRPDLQIAKNNLDAFLQKRAPAAGNPVPPRAAELVNQSLALNQQGRFAESIAAAKEAIRIDPDLPEAWNNIAAGEQSLQHWDEAIAAARKATELRPDFQLAKNNLAWSLSQKEKAMHR